MIVVIAASVLVARSKILKINKMKYFSIFYALLTLLVYDLESSHLDGLDQESRNSLFLSITLRP